MKKLVFMFALITAGLLTSCGEKEHVVTISTEFGDIVVILFDDTPEHKKNFLELANGGFYDGTTFHRIVDGFMIQGGDPNSKDDDEYNDGMGSPGYTIPSEILEHHTHVRGALCTARMPDNRNPEKDSNGSQFYIVEAEDGYHGLDGGYTVFGQTISGIEVIEEIAIQPKTRRNRPLKDITMTMEVKTMSRKKVTKEYGYVYEQ